MVKNALDRYQKVIAGGVLSQIGKVHIHYTLVWNLTKSNRGSKTVFSGASSGWRVRFWR
jgi:hypothetical protein